MIIDEHKKLKSGNAGPYARSKNEGMYRGGKEGKTPVSTAFVQEVAKGQALTG